MLDIAHDTLIPTYFSDHSNLVHLAFLVPPQLGGQALEKIALDYLDVDDETDAEVEVVNE